MKYINKRIAAILLAAVMAAGALAGCGRKKQEEPAAAGQERQVQETEQAEELQDNAEEAAEQGAQEEQAQPQVPAEQEQEPREELTAQSIAGKTVENLREAGSFVLAEDVSVRASVGISFLNTPLVVTSHTDAEYVKEPAAAHQITTSSFSFFGEEESETDESYLVKEGGSSILYNRKNSEDWKRAQTDNSKLSIDSFANASVLDDISSGKVEAQLADTTVEVDGQEAYLLTIRLGGEELETALGSLAAEIGAYSGENAGTPDFTGVTIPASVYIYKDTLLPAKIEIDARETGEALIRSIITSSLKEEGGEEDIDLSDVVTVEELSLVTYIRSYNTVSSLEVPADVAAGAVEAASGE